MDAGAVKAGQAYVEITADNAKLRSGLQDSRRQLQAFGDGAAALASAGVKMMAGAGVMAGLGAFTVQSASNVEELQSRFQALFRGNAEAAGAWAKAMADAVGRSRYELMDSMSTFQAFFVGLGHGQQEALQLSERMTALAVDFASFHNLSDSEGLERFISALSGSSEVLDRFGVNTKQAALQQELLTMGVKKSWTEVSELEKVSARMSIIAKSMGSQGAIGDAAKTAGSFANQNKALQASLQDLRVEIGQSLMTAITPHLAGIRDVIKAMGDWGAANGGAVVQVAQFSAVLGGIGALLVGTGAGINLAITAFRGYNLAIVGMSSVMVYLRDTTLLTAAATRTLGAALAFASANPAVIGFTAISAAIAGIATWAALASKYVADLRNESQQLLEQGDVTRQSDAGKASRLKELSGKGGLTREELAEAGAIARELKGRYGDVGIEVNKLAGSVTAAADSFERLNKSMTDSAAKQVSDRIDEAKRNIRELQEELQATLKQAVEPDMGKMAISLVPILGSFDIALTNVDEKRAKLAIDVSKRLDAAHQELRNATARLRAINEGVPSAVTNAAITGLVGLPGIGGSGAAGKEAEQWQQRIRELLIARIEDTNRREIAALNAKYAAEMREARKAGADREVLSKIAMAQQLDLANLERKAALERNATEINSQSEIAQLRASTIRDQQEREVALINIRIDAEKRIAELRGNKPEAARLEELRQAQLAAIRNGARNDLVANLEDMAAAIEENPERARAALDRQRKIQGMKGAGLDPKLVGEMDMLMRQMEAVENRKRKVSEALFSNVSFSPIDAERMFVGTINTKPLQGGDVAGRVEERKLLGEIRRLLERIAKNNIGPAVWGQ